MLPLQICIPKYLQQVFEGKRHGVQPQNGIPDFSLHFPKELSYDYLRFEGIFPFPSKLVWKIQKKSGIMKSGLDAMPLFLLDDLLKEIFASIHTLNK